MDPAGEPIRVAFVLHVMQVAGAEMLVAEIIRRLGPRLAPLVICLDGIGQLGDQMLREGVPVVALGRRSGLDPMVSRRLAHELAVHRIEVVHAHQYTPFFYSALAWPVVGRRRHLIFTEHGRHYPDIVSAKRRLMNRLVFAHTPDEVTAVCEFSARSVATIEGFGARRIEVVLNGIDVADDAESESPAGLRDGLGLDAGRRYIVCVARFHPVKDHGMLLRAFGTVAAARPDVDLLLVGDGPLRSELEQLVRGMGIQHRVRFLGVRGDVPAILRASDVFALTSVSEAASLTLLEAMAARLPVVVTDVGGNGEIVRAGKEGLLVPRGDAQGAAQMMLNLLERPETARTMGLAGRARVEKHYRLDDTVRAYYQRYLAAAERLRPH